LIWVLTTLQQWLLFTGTALVVGCVAWRVQVLPGAMRALPADGVSAMTGIERRVAQLGLASTAVLVVAWILRMVVQVMGFRDPFVPLWDDVSFLLFEIFWGTVWMVQGAVLLLLAVSLWLAGRSRLGWVAATPLVVALAVTLAMSGHAMGADARTLVVTADAVHMLAVGSWIGSLAVILAVGRSVGAGGSGLFAAQIRRFSSMAQVSVAALISMGVLLSWTHLHAVSDLWTSSYGRILSAKVAVVFGILGLGLWNWRQGLDGCDSQEGAAVVRRRAIWEVSLAVGVILLTAVLVHSAKP
jgi:putative copper export protein